MTSESPSEETKAPVKKRVKKEGTAKTTKAAAAKKKTADAKKTSKKTVATKKEPIKKRAPRVPKDSQPQPVCAAPTYKKLALGTLIGGAIVSFTAAAVQLWKRLRK